MSETDKKTDHWSSQAYNSAAGFVPKLTSKVLSYLNPQPHETILDIGCGDGPLTAQIAQSTSPGRVLGVDASPSFISTAQEKHSADNCTFILHDATSLESCPEAVSGQWDKVFSNAAMHWILRDASIRKTFFANINKALKPGGQVRARFRKMIFWAAGVLTHWQFVFEMGGAGNVAEIQAATIAALLHAGVALERARDASPWFFPTVDWMSAALSEAGFVVDICELEYRPTKLSEATSTGSGGIEGWVKLMCAQYLEAVADRGKRELVVKEICDVLQSVIRREEDQSQWVGYVRLRAAARKR